MEMTKKQFDKAVGHGSPIDWTRPEIVKYLEDHPIEYTSEWIYDFDRFFMGTRAAIGTRPGGSCGGGLDLESEGYYGAAKYMADHEN